ncbi:hypothetical protein LLH00_06510 [bacterium]|nr:hypothetical protein [bacterium]
MDNSDETRSQTKLRIRKNVTEKVQARITKQNKSKEDETFLEEYSRAQTDLITDPYRATRNNVEITELSSQKLRQKYNIVSTKALYRWKETGGLTRCFHAVDYENSVTDTTVWIVDFVERNEKTYSVT